MVLTEWNKLLLLKIKDDSELNERMPCSSKTVQMRLSHWCKIWLIIFNSLRREKCSPGTGSSQNFHRTAYPKLSYSKAASAKCRAHRNCCVQLQSSQVSTAIAAPVMWVSWFWLVFCCSLLNSVYPLWWHQRVGAYAESFLTPWSPCGLWHHVSGGVCKIRQGILLFVTRCLVELLTSLSPCR